jgi:LysM repeat protein
VALVPFSTATPSLPLCQPRADWEIYIIQAGETLFSIARRYNLTVAQLAAANCLENTRLIYAGDSLRVPRGGPLNLNTSAYQACDSPLAQISFPPPEAEIDGAVTLQGFAFGEGFRRYVLEWRPETENTYRVFEEVYLAVTREGALGTLETNPLPTGLAWLRLRVFDSTDRLLGECAVRVRFR